MFVCPNCTKRLANTTTASGPSWRCSACGGVAFPVATLRKTQVPSATVDGLVERARAGEGMKGRFCPICANWMCGLPMAVENQSVTIDVCNSCQLFWFDPKEFESVMPPAPPPAPPHRVVIVPPVAPRGTAPPPPWIQPPLKPPSFGPLETYSGRDEASLEGYDQEVKMRWWNYLSGFLGLPIEVRSPKRKRTPSATTTLAAVIAGVSFSVYTFFPGVAWWLGFSSEFPFRFLGLTLITSFFVHAGMFHLLGNLYFLMTFGDNVEDFLGVRRFLLLLLGATVVGNVLQFTANPGSNMLLIGASGGIAGIVAFYGLQFRQARVAIFLLRIIPVKLSAVWALVLWFAFQLVGTAMGWVNTDQTAYAAHLGGAATGLILWRQWRTR